MLRQNLSQKQTQKLSPQQIQLMKLLQIPTATLDQRIKEELEANPALDEGIEEEEEQLINSDDAPEEKEETDEPELQDDLELDDYLNDYLDDDTALYKLKANNHSPDDEDKTMPVVVEKSFYDHLKTQLGLQKLSEADREVAKQIIGSIDDDGYLRRDIDAIMDDLIISRNISTSEDKILELLKMIQSFDPPGVGARDLQECLAIQLDRKLAVLTDRDSEESRIVHLAARLIQKYFKEFSKKHYDKLQRSLGVDHEGLKEIVDEILKLNPKPASGYASNSRNRAHYIVADFLIHNRDGELELELNSRNAPDLRLNDHYKDMLRSYNSNKAKSTKKQKEAVMFIKQKIDSAKWFIDAIKQRQQTMYRTMYTILQYQYDFFLTGDQKKLRPMILKDIADITGLDISTVSRVANSKYVQTEFGTKRLKDFFSESLQTSTGEEVSTLEVKKILQEIVAEENKRKPHSDQKIMDLLREAGYNIARRTVAKYREQLSIPVARLRKEL